MIKCFFSIVFVLFILSGYGQGESAVFPEWKEGEMEIHHINTGRGEGVFCIFPDGTNMLIDAGDIGKYTEPVHTDAVPGNDKQPGEWIARYISKLLKYRTDKTIDYAFLTHFHSDHMGKVTAESPLTSKGGTYYLTGISEVAEYVPFIRMIDRDWPDYRYPSSLTGNQAFVNYKNFVDWNIKNNGMAAEKFRPGSNSQFVLLKEPNKYRDFKVQNIYANGNLWTGEKDKTRYLFPENAKLDENKICGAIKISYGKFDYFNGGDITGRISVKSEKWRDIETPLSKVLGPIEVCEAFRFLPPATPAQYS